MSHVDHVKKGEKKVREKVGRASKQSIEEKKYHSRGLIESSASELNGQKGSSLARAGGGGGAHTYHSVSHRAQAPSSRATSRAARAKLTRVRPVVCVGDTRQELAMDKSKRYRELERNRGRREKERKRGWESAGRARSGEKAARSRNIDYIV